MTAAQKQDDAVRAQQAGLFHQQVEQQKRDQRSQAVQMYKEDLAA